MKFITEAQVRDRTHMSPTTLRRAQREQDFPRPVRLMSDDYRGKKLYIEEEVQSWLDRRIADCRRFVPCMPQAAEAA